MNCWLIKSEPFKYSWEDLEKDTTTFWDGVRNFQARNNLRAMKKGDYALFYHSNEGKEIVGIAQISKEAYPDPTDETWVLVDVVPYQKLEKTISLETLKQHPILKNMALVRQSRLSVCPVTQEEFEIICTLVNAKIE
ncbi:ubiquinol-cytochrome C reductase [bacterium 336/3]|jgi:predicted RNA-binding protein with PUA-like domain|nr:ubiquinol-cytochrome C reductase [bacterium 336/3]